ncbi:MAG TPA: hypothetical protein DDW52_25665 [Planctomycetaceae bacterium]|nr:hypothetical protein [Planctomycetaceae bacterium]
MERGGGTFPFFVGTAAHKLIDRSLANSIAWTVTDEAVTQNVLSLNHLPLEVGRYRVKMV